eukprot:GILK01008091.1.p1 GENE.GILK01008091.1~~GILK01008091.1.p1  ORF type:complete len:389 (-),score=90.22 GILK01008091.1:151-1206(-)
MDAESLAIVNGLIRHLPLNRHPVQDIQELHTDELYVLIFQALFPTILPDIMPTRSNHQEDHAINLQRVLETLERVVLQTDISHIQGDMIVMGRSNHILNLLEILQELYRVFRHDQSLSVSKMSMSTAREPIERPPERYGYHEEEHRQTPSRDTERERATRERETSLENQRQERIFHQQQQQQQSTQRRSDKSGSAPRDKPVPISLSSTDGNVSATVPVPSSTAAGAAGVVVGGLTSQEKQERDLRERLQKSQRQAVTATSTNTQQEGTKQDKETVEPVRTNRRVREYPPPPPQNSQQQYPPRGPANPSNQGPVQYSYQERDDFQRDQPPPPPNGRGNPRGDRDKKQYRRNQ